MKNFLTIKPVTLVIFQVMFLTSVFAGQGDLAVNFVKSDVSCFGGSNGSIEISINGGKAPYTISWDNGKTESTLTNLRKGTYTVTVTDAKGKMVEEQISIDMPTAPLAINYSAKEEMFLEGYSGLVNIKVSGGSPWNTENDDNYVVKLNSKLGNEEELTDGVYKLSVEDQKGCKLAVNVNLDIVNELPTNSNEVQASAFNKNYGNVKMTVLRNKKSVNDTDSRITAGASM